MFCGNCGTELDGAEKFCPKCGAPVTAEPEEELHQPTSDDSMAPDDSVVPDDGAAPDDSTEQPEPDENSSAAQNGENAPPAYAGIPTEPYAAEYGNLEEETPKKGKMKWWMVAGAAVIVLLIAAIVNFGAVTQFMRQTFSTPESYYRYVEKKSAKNMASSSSKIYRSMNGNTSGQSADGKMTLSLTDDGKDFVNSMAGLDLSWLNSIGLDFTTDNKDEQLAANTKLSLNDVSVVSVNVLMDMTENVIYGQIPELSEDYFKDTLPDSAGGGYADALQKVYQTMDADELEELITQYTDTVLTYVKDVEKGSKDLKVEDVSVKCTTLDVTIDQKTMDKISKAVAKKMEKDEKLQTMIQSALDSLSASDSDVPTYEEFQDELSAYASGDKTISVGEDGLAMTVWVDHNGEILGREIVAGGVTVDFLFPESGDKYGTELSISDGTDTYALTGSGETHHDKKTGDYSFTQNDQELLKIHADDFDSESMEDGSLNGKLTIQPGDDFAAAAGISSTAGTLLSGAALVLDCSGSRDQSAMTLNVCMNDKTLASLAIDAQRGKAGDMPTVSGAKSTEEWADGIDAATISDFVAKLRSDGVPEEAVSMIESLLGLTDTMGSTDSSMGIGE